MGKIILNGIEYIGGEADNVFAPVIYSDVERKIGVWRDNKPLYAKTISIGTLPNNATKTTAHGISDIDTICSIDGIAYDGSGKTLPLGYINVDSYTYDVQVEVGKVNVEIKTKIDFSSYTGYITLRYTKTTDVAGSGDYNTYGVPTVHYDTNEQVIGTWLGKPLYQKVFTGLSVVLGSDWVNAIDISSLYMENCILGIGIVSNTYQTPLCTRINGNYLQAYMNGMGGVTITTIVIQYTKTTD